MLFIYFQNKSKVHNLIHEITMIELQNLKIQSPFKNDKKIQFTVPINKEVVILYKSRLLNQKNENKINYRFKASSCIETKEVQNHPYYDQNHFLKYFYDNYKEENDIFNNYFSNNRVITISVLTQSSLDLFDKYIGERCK